MYLTALVLVPLTGVVVLSTNIARTRTAEAAGAARAEDAVRAVARLDAARSAVEHETVPILLLAVADDPAAAAALGVPPFMLEGQRWETEAAAHRARVATDRALARVPAGSVGAEYAERAAVHISALRVGAGAGELGVHDISAGYLAVSNELMAAQRRVGTVASSENLPAATLRAIADVELTAALAQTASRQMPLFLGGRLSAGEGSVGFRIARENTRLAHLDAQRRMDDLSQGSLRQAWEATRTSPVVTAVEQALTAHDAPGAAALPAGELVTLVFQSAARDAALADLVDTALVNAQALVAADHDVANHRLLETLQLGLGILLVSGLGAFFLGRSVSRSLGLLAGQATQVSRGSLVEVKAAGPREVRTVSTALGSAVASLRRIQGQARAVASGDLSNALLDEPLPGPLGEVVHASVRQIVSSVRQREELQDALAHQATHDALTGLPNRAQALTLATSALHRARRSGEMTGLLFVDLDGFKAVNDGHGHACGDDVLREVARRMSAVVRPGDAVCRLGGDEFVVLVEQVPAERDLLELAERLIAVVSEPVPAAGQQVRIGASVGVAVSRDAGTDAGALVADADTAAYRAKRRGRGRAEMFDESLRLQLAERAELETAIAEGLANGEMRLHYQPVVDVTSDRLTGYEALVRWQRPEVGLVPPDQFVPVAEGSRLICDLDRWVLHEATRQLAEWRAAAPAAAAGPEPTMAVNISGRHLSDRRVVQDVADALATSGLPARLLVLEVTETVLVDDPAAIGHLAALREMGVAVALDDFGTGYTSIGQLGRMPVDTLKIDRSFIASTEPGHRELVALMIRAAHTFGLTVVAEGVEEPTQLARLRADACDLAQGYLLYRPLPAADAGALLGASPLAGART
ncbi:MAG TPA: EAL domain-containing protein [Geodermatophilus sp.]|nr:EAL domain-containing protein [Geodermatophilus sp.]